MELKYLGRERELKNSTIISTIGENRGGKSRAGCLQRRIKKTSGACAYAVWEFENGSHVSNLILA